MSLIRTTWRWLSEDVPVCDRQGDPIPGAWRRLLPKLGACYALLLLAWLVTVRMIERLNQVSACLVGLAILIVYQLRLSWSLACWKKWYQEYSLWMMVCTSLILMGLLAVWLTGRHEWLMPSVFAAAGMAILRNE